MNDNSQHSERSESSFVHKASNFAKDRYNELSSEIVKALDLNKDGKIGLEDMILLAMKSKTVRVDRNAFLKRAFMKYCDESTIEYAIKTTPAKAHIDRAIIDRATRESTNKQTFMTTAASFGLGYVPGGLAVDVATTVADVGQYYANLLIAMQKMMYLYGFPQLNIQDDAEFIDDGTLHMIYLGIGTMFGVGEAGKAIQAIANHLAAGIEKEMMRAALTKKAAWPIIKKILHHFNIKLTKELASKTVSNMIKGLGGILVGGISFVSFQRCCNRFVKSVNNTYLSNPELFKDYNVIDVKVSANSIYEEINQGIDENNI